MATIKITPESLRGQAQKLEGYKTQHEQAYSQIKTLVEGLRTEWEGGAHDAFFASFESNKGAFEQFSKDVTSFTERLKFAAQEMEQTEASVKAKMSQM